MNRYTHNPLIHRDRRRDGAKSAWVRSFQVDIKPLIVCRGPIRKEAIDTFTEMGMTQIGILLSEKDSIVYTQALAPELRQLPCDRVHRVPDYTGVTKKERRARIQQIIEIAKSNGYDSIFAGYGFMAEDDSFVRTIEEAGLTFIGPCAYTVKSAGLKDEAKRTALAENVSVTPGINNVTSRLLLEKYPDLAALKRCAQEHDLDVSAAFDADLAAEDVAEAVLSASYAKGIDLLTIDEISRRIEHEVAAMFEEYPNNRIRLKAIGGGGGKGQRILDRPPTDDRAASIRAKAAAAAAPEKFREILSEVNAAGVGDNKNVLIELNIEQTRHNEIQLLGNGEWCVALGGRDCSLQMHEQKLLEISSTQEALITAAENADRSGQAQVAAALRMERQTLANMETEGERFGRAVKLDSASTFECIVENDRHYFMEVNTRIQVEHRVTELCYTLRFVNPEASDEWFDVTSLVEAMALLAQHKQRLPRPQRILREPAAVEARLNATDASLSPHAGGIINYWSDPVEGEIRDDQGISAKNPDTGLFVRYKVAGAYDSNIALLVTTGKDRADSYHRLSEILRCTQLRGVDLETNLEFHYGLVNWFIHRSVWAKPTTRFVSAYLAQAGLLKQESGRLDLSAAWSLIRDRAAQRPHISSATLGELMLTKHTLVQRPVRRLLASPHLLSGWLSRFSSAWSIEGDSLVWKQNPLKVLEQTYHFLNMFDERCAPPSQLIWDHDDQILKVGLGFYRRLQARLKTDDYATLTAQLDGPAPSSFDAELWSRVKGAHIGHHAHTLSKEGYTGFMDARPWDEYFPSKERQLVQEVKPEKLPTSTVQIDNSLFYNGLFDWAQLDIQPDEMGDAKVVDWANKQLSTTHEKPLFLAVGIYRPHIPWYTPKSYFDKHPIDKVELPEIVENDLGDIPQSKVDMINRSWQKWMVDNNKWKEAVQAYNASVSFTDDMIGRLLDALEKGPLRDNTIVVLWTDHGYHLGQKEHWEKFALWEQTTRVPFIVAAPGMKSTHGKISKEPVSLLDIYPTLNELCDFSPNPDLDGQSLIPLLNNTELKTNRSVITSHGPGNHGIRSNKWRYIRYTDETEELYDQINDPKNFYNLANNPEYKDVIEELAKWIPKKEAETHPPEERKSKLNK
ncbi:MAG: sulfatase-like hydrolase/transferase [Myxococcota bacterium]